MDFDSWILCGSVRSRSGWLCSQVSCSQISLPTSIGSRHSPRSEFNQRLEYLLCLWVWLFSLHHQTHTAAYFNHNSTCSTENACCGVKRRSWLVFSTGKKENRTEWLCAFNHKWVGSLCEPQRGSARWQELPVFFSLFNPWKTSLLFPLSVSTKAWFVERKHNVRLISFFPVTAASEDKPSETFRF